MTGDDTARYIVVGVTQKQPLTVLREAARFARLFNAALVCANVDAGSYVVAEHPDGSVESRPIDPDQPDGRPMIVAAPPGFAIHSRARRN